MNNLDEDIKIVKDARKFLAKIGLIKERDAISNVLTQLNVNKYDINNYEERITSLKSELETYKKRAEKLANRLATKSDDCFFCEKYNGSKCEIYKNRTQCIIDWARKEVENEI